MWFYKRNLTMVKIKIGYQEQQLKKLSKYVSKLHEITEKNCKEKIESFV